MKDRSHDDAMEELFRDDPALAAATLNAILADGDQGELLVTLRQMNKVGPEKNDCTKGNGRESKKNPPGHHPADGQGGV